MKRSLFTQFQKRALLAVPTAALMLGAAQAQTTVGLNFQTWYYDSGQNPQTIGFMGTGYSAYDATGFPVTAKAFGVTPANWFNTDPLQGNPNNGGNPINQACTFGGTSTTFAGGLSCYVNSPIGGFQSGSGCELASGITFPSYAPGVWCPPGDDEALWGIIVGNAANPFSVSVSGLAAKFPHGYVMQSVAAHGGSTTVYALPSVDFTDGATTNTAAYHTWVIDNSPVAQWPTTTAGISDPSGVFTADTIYLLSQGDVTNILASLAGVIFTDQPVISTDPTGGGYLPGQSINLSAGAFGIPPLSYQWRSNGIPIPGATTTTYGIPSAVAGNYAFDVVATNLYGSATSGVATVTVVVPANLTWDANTGTTGAQDGSGTWDDGLTANWWNGSGDVVWGSLDNAVFGAGGTGTYTVTVASNVIVNSLTFNSGNYTIAGAGLTLGGEPQIVVNTNATISLPLAGSDDVAMSGTGTLNVTGNNTFTGDLAVNGGTLQGGTTQGNAASGYLGAVNGARTITVASGATIAIHNNNVFGGSGMTVAELPAVVLNGGTFNSTRYNSLGNVGLNSGATLSQSASDSGSYQGYQFLGTITVGGSSASTISTGNGKGDHLLGGQTNTFNVADVTGDASSDLILSVPLIDGSGDYKGVGALLKTGGGTLELAAVNTFTGTTIVGSGTLLVSGQLAGGGDIDLSDASALNVAASLNNPIIPSGGNLTLGSSGASTNALGFANLNSATVAPITVGSLSVINRVKVNITGAIATTGSYPLIQYSGESGSGTITLGALPSGVSATLVDDHSSSISLNVTVTPVQSEVWAGNVSGIWDINNTANWKISAVSAKYEEGDVATFDDTASGTTAVTLNTVVHPAIVIFTNTVKTYSLSGSGSIAGATSLYVNGGGMATLGNTNTYAGGTIINAGTLAVGADANLGTAALTLNGGTLDLIGTTAFASTKSIALNNSGAAIQVDNPAGASLGVISGTGALTKTGNGTLTFSAQQPYTGGTIVNGGILDLAGGGGASGVIFGQVTVNTNATLKIDTGDAFGYNGGGTAINNLYLTGGTLNINSTANQTLGDATISLTGGAITGLSGANLDFFGGSSALNTMPASTPSTISGAALSPLRQGSTTFDIPAGTTASGIDLDISSVLRQSPSGDAAGAVLLKADTGTLRLSAVNTYAGGTEVQGGKLILTGRLIGGGSMTVDDGTELDVSAGVAPAILSTTSDLTLGGGGGVLTLGLANISSPTVPVISMVNLMVNDAVTVNISGHVAVGQFPLIKYSGSESGAGAFTLGTLPAGVSATLVNNTANQSLDLHVTSAPLSIVTDISSGTNIAYAGANYSWFVSAGGTPTLGYQWYFDNTPIQGATSTTLALTRISTANSGSYYVIVTNASGAISSSTNHLVVLPVSGYAALAMATGPTAFWPLNETNGTTAFDIWGGYNANYGGGYTLDYEVNPHTGTPGVHFDGASGLALTPYAAALNPAVFTAEAWVNPDAVPSSEYCALSCGQFASSGRSGWLIYQFSGYWDLRTYYGNGTSIAVEVKGTTAPVVGSWTHLAVTWDGTTASLYVNGGLQNSAVSTNSYLPGVSGGFCAGARADSSFYFPGGVSDAAIYSRVLTAQEIQTHAQNQPVFTLTPSAGKVVLSWLPSGFSLLSSPLVNGPYTNVPAATSPWTVTPSGTQFYGLGF